MEIDDKLTRSNISHQWAQDRVLKDKFIGEEKFGGLQIEVIPSYRLSHLLALNLSIEKNLKNITLNVEL